MSSCDEISGQIAGLSAAIGALEGKFASKKDITDLQNQLSKYIPKNEKQSIIDSSVTKAEI